MKRLVRFIPIFTFIVITALTIFFLDFKEANEYISFSKFESEYFTIRYEEDRDISRQTVKYIQDLANKHHIIVLKSNLDYKKKNGNNVYLSLKNGEELIAILQDNFSVKLNQNNIKDHSFISTYQHNNENQIGYIRDLMGDHYYTYYLMDELIDSNSGLHGRYTVLYKNYEDYSRFILELNETLGYDTSSDAIYLSSNFIKYIGFAIIGSLVFLLLFYFIFQIYAYYNQSKKIGCMKLLGYDNKKINQKMIRKNIYIYMISMMILLLLSVIFIPNISIKHILILLLLYLFIILITYLLSRLSCYIIMKDFHIINILKKQNVSTYINYVSYKLKLVMLIILILFCVLAFQNVSVYLKTTKQYREAKQILEYGIFSSFVIEDPAYHDLDRQYQFYLDLLHDSELETFYAHFPILSSDPFQYGNVDKNYLKKENITVYDLNHNKVNIDNISGVFFLFPKSRQNEINDFSKYYEEDSKYYYETYSLEYHFQAYLYDDMIVPTYHIEEAPTKVKNFIIRVVDESIRPNLHDSITVSLFGNGLNTGLKIKVKENTLDILGNYLEKHEMTGLLTNNSFVSFKDYFSEQIRLQQVLFLFLSIVIAIIILVYFLISFQITKLFLHSHKNRVVVKKILGFDNEKIFSYIYKKSFRHIIIAFTLSLLLLLLIHKLNILIFIILLFSLTILDCFTIWLSIKTSNMSQIYLDVKGGNYD